MRQTSPAFRAAFLLTTFITLFLNFAMVSTPQFDVEYVVVWYARQLEKAS